MSYSFSFAAANKAEAITKAKAELDSIAAAQPSHVHDRTIALATIKSFIDLLREPGEGEHLGVAVSGSLSWQADDVFTGTNISVSAYINR